MNESTSQNILHRNGKYSLIFIFVLILGVAIGEWLGWPFLAGPLQRTLSSKLERHVIISNHTDFDAAKSTSVTYSNFKVRFIGGLRLYAPQLEIAAPEWSKTPHFILARDVALKLRYVDLWHAYRGQPLTIRSLQASMLDGDIERMADGRSSWQFGSRPSTSTIQLPVFEHLGIASGTLRYLDEPFKLDVETTFSLINGSSLSSAASANTASANAVSATASSANASNVSASNETNATERGLKLRATGHYRTLPLEIELLSSGEFPGSANDTWAVLLTLNATVGKAKLFFEGSAMDVLHLSGITGQFKLDGPSLAAVGEPVGITLPTTASFSTYGSLAKLGDTWRVAVTDATVGASSLNGNFIYEMGRDVPMLSGELNGARLLLVDLGPVVGTTPAASGLAAAPRPVPPTRKGRVLPDRPFDLPSLRAMDADVVIDIHEVNLNTSLLEPLRPLKAHLRLTHGVLTLSNLSASTGQGKLFGKLRLDGRGSKALWSANLRWEGIRLERWIKQRRRQGVPPFISGKLNGNAKVKGQGISTAEILGSLNGRARTELLQGKVSHLVVEMAGLDFAESFGVMLQGDNQLPVQCGVVDLIAKGGIFRPKVMVVDTTDTAVWVEGSLSMATEAINLRAVVTPKDFSPMTLRTPLLLRGTFSNPKVSIDKKPLEAKLATSLLLGLINPLAALIPLIDTGNTRAAKRDTVGCKSLMEKAKEFVPAYVPGH